MLERNQEAYAFFELANAILELELGSDHERTMTSARNLGKAKRTVSEKKPEYQPLWSFAALAPGPKPQNPNEYETNWNMWIQ